MLTSVLNHGGVVGYALIAAVMVGVVAVAAVLRGILRVELEVNEPPEELLKAISSKGVAMSYLKLLASYSTAGGLLATVASLAHVYGAVRDVSAIGPAVGQALGCTWLGVIGTIMAGVSYAALEGLARPAVRRLGQRIQKRDGGTAASQVIDAAAIAQETVNKAQEAVANAKDASVVVVRLAASVREATNNVKEAANNAKEAAGSAKEAANSAKEVADSAKEVADSAKEAAVNFKDAVNNTLSEAGMTRGIQDEEYFWETSGVHQRMRGFKMEVNKGLLVGILKSKGEKQYLLVTDSGQNQSVSLRPLTEDQITTVLSSRHITLKDIWSGTVPCAELFAGDREALRWASAFQLTGQSGRSECEA